VRYRTRVWVPGEDPAGPEAATAPDGPAPSVGDAAGAEVPAGGGDQGRLGPAAEPLLAENQVVEVAAAGGRPAILEVFCESAADGSEQDLFRVPLTLGAAGPGAGWEPKGCIGAVGRPPSGWSH